MQYTHRNTDTEKITLTISKNTRQMLNEFANKAQKKLNISFFVDLAIQEAIKRQKAQQLNSVIKNISKKTFPETSEEILYNIRKEE